MKLLYSPLKGCFVCLIICCALCYRAGAQNYFVGGDVRYGHVLCNSAESRADINFPTYGILIGIILLSDWSCLTII